MRFLVSMGCGEQSLLTDSGLHHCLYRYLSLRCARCVVFLQWNLPARPKLCTSEMEKRHTCVGERASGFCFVQSGSPLPSPHIPMCYKASCSQNRLGMKCHRLKLEDGKTRCKLELSAGTQPLQPHPSAFPTGLGRI